MSASCGTDAALGDLPLVYPFLVNDPGEGTQAKRRAHATLVDHLIPPMARAETYGDIARLEQLLDEHANVAALDPAKLPAIRQQIWTLMQAAKLDHDLGLEERPHEAEFDEMHPARRRLALRDQGRPDPRRPAHPRRRPGGRRAGGPGARDAARPPDVGRRAEPAGPARGPGPARRRAQGPGRRGRGAGARPRRGHGGRRLGPRRGARRRRRGRDRGSRGGRRARPGRGGTGPGPRSSGCSGSRRRRSCRGSTRPCRRSRASCTPSTAASSPPGPSGSPLRGLVNVLPDRPELLLRRPQGRPVAAGVGDRAGDGRVAGRALPSRPRRRVPAQRRPVRVGHAARCGRPATTSPRSSRCSASARSGTRRPAASPRSR